MNPVPASVCRAFGARLVIAVSLGSDTYGLGMVTEGDKVEGMDFGFEEKREGRRSIGRAMVSRATRPQQDTGHHHGDDGSPQHHPGQAGAHAPGR